MKNVLKCGALVAIFIFLAALPAHADSGDTYSFELSGPVSASWTMSENPTPMYSEDGTVFAVESTDLIVDGLSVSDILCFFNAGDLGGLNSAVVLPDFFGPQVYSGDESNPTFQTGVYYFSMDTGQTETLTITQTPEPATLLLLFSGVAVLGLKRKRQSASLQQ
jgi:PEP-CTERM motif